MVPLRVSEIVRATNGTLLGGSPQARVEAVSIDSRAIDKKGLFVPLVGERHDGMAFVVQALAAGAAGALVTRWNAKVRAELGAVADPKTILIKVRDGQTALQQLASYVRTKLDVHVVGITGSTGKTTTKDFLAAMLAREFDVIAAERSFNNEVGVPMTILRADRNTQALVLEMAMRGRGEIAHLADMARPDVGVITNVGKTHFEFLGSEERIAEAKGELVEAIPPDGVVVLNADDYWTHKMRALSRGRIVTYGTHGSANVRAEDMEVDAEGRATFVLRTRGRRRRVRLPVLGLHNVYNFCASAAVALELGVALGDIVESLKSVTFSAMRMQLYATADGVTVLNDAYNANPTSMRAALDTLAAIKTSGKKIAVLGDMTELGSMTDVAHFQVGEQAARAGVDLLVTVGRHSGRIADGAMVAGMGKHHIRRCQTSGEASKFVKRALEPADVVLVKASRVMRLEEVVDGLV
ncbi:MAG: UDP-N-acetylmuramoyl-tripeptide--D-alanyl-D-alanine ligase [Actinobacteria bacterium]|nr:MAG: UDP-N-acetylmuramoyl-tripeptide--D-alanyl-D-alanine ligase [Actinomycetota bacterium]